MTSLGQWIEPGLHQKILFIINSLTGGGAERVLATLLRHSEPWRDRFDIELALLDDEADAYAVPEWIRVHRLDCGFSLIRSARRLRTLVAARSPDITLSFLTRSNVANAYAMAGRARPWVISERVNTSAHLGTGRRASFGRAMVRASYPRADAIIAVSEGVSEDLRLNFGVSADRLVAIANPIDAEAIRALSGQPNRFADGAPYVFAMGRLVENKNFAMLIDAFARSGLDGRLIIGGEGPLRAQLQGRIDALGLRDRVELAGFLENPFAAVAGARFFVLPSNAEGFPNGLVEAMAIGKAVISTNCPSGPAEILADRPRAAIDGLTIAPHGVLVPCNDADALAQAMQRLADPALCADLADRALHRALEYTPERAAQRYWGVIEHALAPVRAR